MLQPPHPLYISLYGKYGNFNTLQNWNGSLNYKIMTKYCTTGSVNTAPYKCCTTVLVIQECTNVVQLIIIQQHTNIAQLALSYSNTQLLEMLYTWPWYTETCKYCTTGLVIQQNTNAVQLVMSYKWCTTGHVTQQHTNVVQLAQLYGSIHIQKGPGYLMVRVLLVVIQQWLFNIKIGIQEKLYPGFSQLHNETIHRNRTL